MLREVEKYLRNGQLIEIIYLDRNGHTSKRTLRLHSIKDNQLKAYCLTRNAYRVFSIENILAVVPVVSGHAAGH